MKRLFAWIPPLLVGAMLAVLLLVAWARRLPYRYDLEWMEGGMLAHAWRVQHGLPLYPEPGADWVPFIYPPGYPSLLAVFGDALGHPAGRAVSLAGTALGLLGVAWIVGRNSASPHRWIAAGIAALLFAGTWADVGTFHDLVRPDALAVGLVMLSIAVSLERGVGGPVLGGMLLAAAFWLKHPMAAFGPAMVLGLWLRDGRLRGAVGYLLASVSMGGALVAVTQMGNPNFLTYLLQVPASHEVVLARIWPGLPWEIGSAWPIVAPLLALAAVLAAAGPGRGRIVGTIAFFAMAVAAVALGARDGTTSLGPIDALASLAPAVPLGSASQLRTGGPVLTGAGMAALVGLAVAVLAALGRLVREREERWALVQRAALPVLLGATALALVALMRGHHGGYVNVYLPLYALIAVATGLALAAGSARWPRLGPWVLGLAAAAQLGVQAARVDLPRYTPTEQDSMVGDSVVAKLAALDGPVWSPVAPWLAVQAGQEPGPHLIALWDVSMHPSGPWPDTGSAIERALKQGRWAYVLDGRRPMGFGVHSAMVEGKRLALPPGVWFPRVGWKVRGERFLVMRGEEGAGDAAETEGGE